MRFGYTLMTEQSGPRELVRYAAAAEEAGFDFEVSSDHFSPWLAEQGHAPNAWVLLGAVAQATSRVELMSFVTCPTMRYHPAVVAQQAATLQLLADGRFTLGLGAGENLNEHVIGEGWPGVAVRHDLLEEAIHVIRELLTGELVTWEGQHFRIESGHLWDVPDAGVQIGVAVSGERGVERFAPLADHLVQTTPDADVVRGWRARHPGSTRVFGQVPVCWDPDEDAAVARAHAEFRWFGGGWAVNADLPTPAGFTAAAQFVRPDDVAASIACGPDLDKLAESARPFLEAGFTDLAFVQVGDHHQERFLAEAAAPLLERARAL
ncbi:TIGR03557 family F420-dependent LLM class oxidoreductase [Promicromonospora kroppenstedtii]|uniref:TIGR03557 family F420-dependent LLM class oxidoreductase n=1 Tax=Promicromonospora kroppenstedtii TaxID=440482 RepID=UPI000562FDDA|nr:TIGR03557 family F420-dependent LLM class oxidoreductase [Promicromonospora kroppenstedtii]